jgi:hypothetical protein
MDTVDRRDEPQRPADHRTASASRPTLADRVAAARARLFVGRATEREFFARAVASPDPPFAVLFVHGPGGIGKTALLGEYRRIADAAGYRAIAIDGRSCEPSPPGVLAAIAGELGVADPERCLGLLAAQDRLALFIDTAEMLQPLDGWLRNDLLPRLPASAITVIAGRYPPDLRWRASPGWEDLVAFQALRNLAPEDSRAYLAARGVPETAHSSVLAFTRGHPLALSLAGDVTARGDAPFAPEDAPDVVAALLEHFIAQEPSPRHRQALEVCATARVTTETLLARVFGEDDAHTMFTWLCGLSFIERDRDGVFPHDLARDVLVANLRWRHPARFVETHRTVHDHVVERVRATRGREQFAELYSLMFMHRNNPTWQSFAPMEQRGHEYIVPGTPDDHGLVIDTVQRHEGVRSAEITDRWLAVQPEGLSVLRDIHGELSGFLLGIELATCARADVDFDPVVTAILDMMDRHGPLRPGDEAMCARFCMGRDTYRTPTLRLSFSMIGSGMIYTRPRLAWMVTPVVDPDYWRSLFSYVHINPYPDADVTVDGRTWHMYAHDWRREPIEVLDRLLTEREMSLSPIQETPPTAPALMVLSEADFRQAVRQALRDYHRADALAASPLRHSRLVVDRRGEDAVTALRELLRDAAAPLADAPRTRRLHDALRVTWFEPERTQEAAAEALDLPFSTYRRHLAAAVDHVTGELWRRELALGTFERG